MLIEITYKDSTEPFLAISDNIVYAYVENSLIVNEDTGILSTDTSSELVLKFETPNSQIVSLETRAMLYNIYKAVNSHLDTISNISLYNTEEYIETISDEEGTLTDVLHNANVPILDTASINLAPMSVSLIDRALTSQTQDTNDYTGITVSIKLKWNEGGK